MNTTTQKTHAQLEQELFNRLGIMSKMKILDIVSSENHKIVLDEDLR